MHNNPYLVRKQANYLLFLKNGDCAVKHAKMKRYPDNVRDDCVWQGLWFQSPGKRYTLAEPSSCIGFNCVCPVMADINFQAIGWADDR
jgi:hypothetical protein